MADHSWLAMPWLYKDKLQFAAFALLFLFCLVRKLPQPECLCSGMLFGMLVVDRLHHFVLGGSIVWHNANIGHLCIDSAAMVISLAIALYANRVYPLWIAGAQIIAMCGHFYRLGLEGMNTFAYDMMIITPSYIQLIAMCLGIVFHMSRRRKLGNYPSWRHCSRPMRLMKRMTWRAG